MYEVTETKKINWNVTDGIDEVLQNVAFILSSIKGTCPMDRDFAWDPNIDAPIEVSKALLASRVKEVVEQNEPRAEVIEIIVEEHHETGELKPKVKVNIRGEI